MRLAAIMSRLPIVAGIGLSALFSVQGVAAGSTQQTEIQPPAISLEQVAAGQAAYRQSCALCHGGDLRGANAPALIGQDILGNYGSVGGLYDFIAASMPPQAPGGMSPADYAAVVAYLLSQNGACAGDHALMSSPVADRDLMLASLAGGCANSERSHEQEQPGAEEAAVIPQAYTWGKVLPSVTDDVQ